MSVIPSLCPFGGMKGLVTDRKARKRSQVAEVSDQKLLSELNQGTSRMVDTYIYPYPALIRETKPFANVTANEVKVAIIGSGFAGFCAAYELKQAGIKTIDMYESREKMGGRANTEVIEAGGKSYACEMGAMRVPDNSKLFWHYLSKLQPGQDPSLSPFPNPGIVPTQMLYQCEKFNWHDSDQMPQEWQDISTDFNQFTADGLTYRSEEDSVEITLAQVSELLVKDSLSTADIAIVHTYWDHFLEIYEDVSFIEALTTYMDGKDGRPEWGPEQINMFSTLGLGTGGFGPLFPVCFLEIFRLLLWSYTDEYTPNKTMTEIIGLFNDEVQPNYINQTVHYVGIDRTDSNKANVYVRNGDNIEHQQYDFVIVATTLRSMQISMNLDGANAPGFAAQSLPVFNGEANEMLRQSIRVPHIMNSSKLFGYLPQKPWQNIAGWPTVNDAPVKCVLTDTLARQIYFLDPYPDDAQAGVNVLISYNWGDDSVKIMGLEDYHPDMKLEPEGNGDYTLKNAYQTALETAACNHVAQALEQIEVKDQHDHLKSIIWQKEPMLFGAFKIDFPQQYQYTSHMVYQYQYAKSQKADFSKRVFVANNNCSFQGGWIEGALQSGVNAASAVLKVMADNGQASDFRMDDLFACNPFAPCLQRVLVKYKKLKLTAA